MRTDLTDRTEWLETDGEGGFASGTATGVRTRRYHALLLPATTPPTGRIVLVNGFDAWADVEGQSFALSTQRYVPDVLSPDGASRVAAFATDPWPTWEFELPGSVRIRQEIFIERASRTTNLVWTLLTATPGVRLRVRPFLSGRDYHSLHHENGAFRFEADSREACVTFAPYEGVPAITVSSNGDYDARPEWYRQFLYAAEHERGLDEVEDLAAPGVFSFVFDGAGSVATLRLSTGSGAGVVTRVGAARAVLEARQSEGVRRSELGDALDRAADAYLVRRGAGRSLVAGYPWFTDWGRDTFMAMRGLCLATGRLADARDILVEWAGAVSEGMLPNRFPDHGEQPEFNSVDASLWFVVTAGEFLAKARVQPGVLGPGHAETIERTIGAIIDGYSRGTRFGIRMDGDGLLAAGERGQQLTWMDARVGDREITPRIGKPVEVQALWYNALAVAASLDSRWRPVMEQVRSAFETAFWSEADGMLADVVDVDHAPGTRDLTLRPNQILAVGGLPLPLLEGRRASQVVDAVERHLVTPAGLRSLSPQDPAYCPRYEGPPWARDAAYHQGTVWSWLYGPFIEAWLRAHGNTPRNRRLARAQFQDPWRMQLASGGGHLPEIADAEAPHPARGCPFQAWSLGEFIRIERGVLAAPLPSRKARSEPAYA